jgi:hypothetical protein
MGRVAVESRGTARPQGNVRGFSLAGVVASNSDVCPPTTGSFLLLLALVLDLFLDSFKICNLKAKRLSIPIPMAFWTFTHSWGFICFFA